MTLPQSTRYKLHQPVVLTTEFDVTFPIFSTTDITVYVNAVKTTLFSITATFANGRSTDAKVVLNSAVTGVDVEIYGTRSPRRENQYLGNSPNLSDNLQNDADALTAVQQEQARDAAGVLRVSPKVEGVSPLAINAAGRAGRAIKFTTDGLGLEPGPSTTEITQAEGHAAKAKAWADNDVDAEVESGKFSSKHHAAKSKDWSETAKNTEVLPGEFSAKHHAARSKDWSETAENTAVEPGLYSSKHWAAKAAASAASVQVTQVKDVTASRAIVVGDRHALLRCSNTPTLTLPLAATLGNGFWFDVTEPLRLVTIAATGAELINNKATFKALRGEVVRVICDGVRFIAFVLNKGLTEEINITSNTALSAHDVPTGVRGFRYNFHGFKPQTDGAFLILQVGQNGASGSFFEAAAGYFNNDFGAAPGITASGGSINGFTLSIAQDNNGSHESRGYGDGIVQGFSYFGNSPVFRGHRAGVIASGTENHSTIVTGRLTDASIVNCNAFRVKANTGLINQLHMRIDWEI